MFNRTGTDVLRDGVEQARRYKAPAEIVLRLERELYLFEDNGVLPSDRPEPTEEMSDE